MFWNGKKFLDMFHVAKTLLSNASFQLIVCLFQSNGFLQFLHMPNIRYNTNQRILHLVCSNVHREVLKDAHLLINKDAHHFALSFDVVFHTC
jgi:hypothetical protein